MLSGERRFAYVEAAKSQRFAVESFDG
jgi:hypothetical protein